MNDITCTPQQPTTLNVIFQGLVVFFQHYASSSREPSITALIPNLGTDHAYRAGNWLSEISLAPGRYKLAGVDPGGTGSFWDEEHTLLTPTNIRPMLSQHELWARLELPQPHHIASFRTVRISRDKFVNADCIPGDIQCLKVANTHIFSYQVSKPLHNIRLRGHPWAPDADYCSKIANLHVLASPETRPRVPHHVDEFHIAASLLDDIELQLKENLPNLPPLPSQKQIWARGVSGVIPAELEDLSSRNIRLGEMGRVIRNTMDDTGWLDVGGIWSVIDELSEPLACTATGAGGK